MHNKCFIVNALQISVVHVIPPQSSFSPFPNHRPWLSPFNPNSVTFRSLVCVSPLRVGLLHRGHPHKNKDSYGKSWDFPGGTSGKEPTCQCKRRLRDPCSIPGLGRSPGEGRGNPVLYSCLENPMDQGAWQAMVDKGSQRVGLTEQLSRHAWESEPGSLLMPPPEKQWRISLPRCSQVLSYLPTSEADHLGRNQAGSKQRNLNMPSIYLSKTVS